jgi:hypothetical protein
VPQIITTAARLAQTLSRLVEENLQRNFRTFKISREALLANPRGSLTVYFHGPNAHPRTRKVEE